MQTQRICALCGQLFEIELKRGGQRKYCLECEPEGYSVVTLPSGRKKLRRSVPLMKRSDLELMWRPRSPAA
jgi:hypothetical protein